MTLTKNILAVALALFVLIISNTTLLQLQSYLALFGMLGLVFVFLQHPLIPRWEHQRVVQMLDLLLVVLTVLSFGYVFVQSEPMLSQFWINDTMLGDRAGDERTIDYVVAGIGAILVLEGTRRVIGWTLPILCLVFIAYAYFGQSVPGWLFPHRGFSLAQISQKTFLQYGGVFGIALDVMFKYVFLFVLFGTLLEQTGATEYIIRVARNLFRSSTGGPAKVAVVSSGLMGSLSGSAVANTATTGTFTIPLMRSSGFKPETAGGIEAAASAGGALMPPIMGAGAYMMLDVGNFTLPQVLSAALIPALMYYGALLLTVHFHSRRIGATAEVDHKSDINDKTPATAEVGKLDSDSGSSFAQGMVFVGAFAILIICLFTDLTVSLAVSIGMVGIIVLSMFSRDTRLTIPKTYEALVQASRSGVALIVAASCVGIILGVVSLTGIGAKLPPQILALSGESVIAALLLLMVSTIVLGMGLPSAVCYLLMAYLLGPMLGKLGTPPLAAHLFVFYFGMMSMVTPPVALAAYAAAAIAKGDVIKTAFQAFRFSLVGFALPFSFVLNPELLLLTPDNEPAGILPITLAVIVASVAIYGLAAALAGQATGKLNWGWRVSLFGLSMIIFFTRGHDFQFWVQLGSAAILAVVMIAEHVRSRGRTSIEIA